MSVWVCPLHTSVGFDKNANINFSIHKHMYKLSKQQSYMQFFYWNADIFSGVFEQNN